MNPSRHLPWVLAALVFGALVLPFLVYYTGVTTLGPYSRGGPFAFLSAYFGDLARLRAPAWILLLGPAVLVLVWRVMAAYAWRRES